MNFNRHKLLYPQNNAGEDYAMRYEDTLPSAGGRVLISQFGTGVNEGYGNFILIKHDNNYRTLYAHLRKRLVKVGERVELGQRIGVSGSTGYSTGPHLHFEVINPSGKRVDPAKHLIKPYQPYKGNGGIIVPDGIKGNDLSHWNKIVKVADLAEWGSKFCWIKLTQGDWFVDDQADRFYDQCLANGILPSFYHFYEGEPPMGKQVEWFIKHLRNREVYLPIALDFEDTKPTATLHKFSKSYHTQYVYQFAKSMQFYSGFSEITIYSRKNLWEKYIKTGAYEWDRLMQWKANSQNMQPWGNDWTVWQYGQKQFNGVLIDTNVWNPRKEFPPQKNGTTPPPPPPPAPGLPDEIKVNIGAIKIEDTLYYPDNAMFTFKKD